VRVLQLHMRETTVQSWFVPWRNVTDFVVTLFATYSETDSVRFNDASVYVRKLDFQSNLCEAFAEEKKSAIMETLFGMASFAKDCFQPLLNRISIKTLEKLPTVFT